MALKQHFWASVSGVAGALLIKMRLLLSGPPGVPAEGNIEEATSLISALLRSLHHSLAGKEDSTLLSQTKLMRQESRDGLTSLKNISIAIWRKLPKAIQKL